MKKLLLIFPIALVIAFNSTYAQDRAWISSEYNPGVEYRQDETSSMVTIIINSVLIFGMNLATLEDRIYVLFGDDRARDALNAKLHDMSYVHNRAADAETLTHKITTGMLWLLLLSIIGGLVWAIIAVAKN